MAKILIVDDDEVMSKLYINKLTADGHEVHFASDGDQAIACLAKRYDLMIFDIMIPKVDGLSLLKKARKGVNKKTPIIVYTNLLNEDTKKKAIELGATEVMFKVDFTPFTFIDTIKKYLK